MKPFQKYYDTVAKNPSLLKCRPVEGDPTAVVLPLGRLVHTSLEAPDMVGLAKGYGQKGRNGQPDKPYFKTDLIIPAGVDMSYLHQLAAELWKTNMGQTAPMHPKYLRLMTKDNWYNFAAQAAPPEQLEQGGFYIKTKTTSAPTLQQIGPSGKIPARPGVAVSGNWAVVTCRVMHTRNESITAFMGLSGALIVLKDEPLGAGKPVNTDAAFAGIQGAPDEFGGEEDDGLS